MLPTIAVKINAKNDANGNPRRGWIMYEANGRIAGFVDEGYQGRGALADEGFRFATEVSGEDIPVTPGFYRTMKKKHGRFAPSRKVSANSRRAKRTSRRNKRTSRKAR